MIIVVASSQGTKGDKKLPQPVVFCVCRDYFGVADNVSAFEKRVQGLKFGKVVKECPPNTIHTTFGNHSYMKKHISKWDEGRERKLAIQLKNLLECA